MRASFLRALTASAVIAAALSLAGCYGEESYQLPTKAMKELSPQTLALLEKKNMPKDSPILIRLFKEESELEVWKQDTSGRFQIVKVYPICRWSGDLGPKVHEGDRQAPEGAASILWRDATKAQDAASNMKITAQDLLRLGVIDTIVPEPTGGAHRDPAATIAAAGAAIGDALSELRGLDPATIVRLRREKFMAIGRTLS